MKRMFVVGALFGASLLGGGLAAPAAAAILDPLASLQVGGESIGLSFNGIAFGIDLGPTSVSPGLYGPFVGGPIVGPTGPGFTFLDMTLAFTITGGGDRADLDGFTQVQAVPEPTTIALVGMGLIAAARRLRR